MALHLKLGQHSITEHDVCHDARTILKRLTDANYQAYLVGGAVRDLLQNVTPKDFDIATSAHPEEVRRVFSNCRLIGRRFRLAHIYFGHTVYEVATFRAPHDESGSGVVSSEGRIIHDNVYGSMEEDALRRDFTVNALYYDLKSGEIIDHVDGLRDVEKQQLRLIGDPELRYREDPVRMLRAVRFAAKLNYSIESSSEAPIPELAPLLSNIAPARLFDETLKLFHGGSALKVFHLLRHYGLFQYLFPATAQQLEPENDPEERYLQFIEAALKNTDLRLSESKPVTPAFLFAVMLWQQQQRLAQYYREQGEPDYQANQLAASEVLREQVSSTAVPRRFSNITRDIWQLQARFVRRDCKASHYFVGHRRFRAAYDFYCLRSRVETEKADICQWWTQFYDASEEERLEMCKFIPKTRKRKTRKKPKKS